MECMIKIGDKIKELRLLKGLTQAELAEGICTQASISNLESNTSMPSLLILLEIGSRLNIEFSELSDYVFQTKNPNTVVFEQVRLLRSQFKDKEAHELLKEKMNIGELHTAYDYKHYYYYIGITSLIGNTNFSDALYNFDMALSVENEPNIDFLNILATNGIGLTYFMQEEQDKALTYFEKSLSQLEDYLNRTVSFKENIEIMKIYFTTAKFYSAIGEYSRALYLCNQGIMLQKEEHTNYDLDRLYYEKAFNLFQLGNSKKAEKYYYCAGSLADMSGNTILSAVIKKDMTDFNMTVYPF